MCQSYYSRLCARLQYGRIHVDDNEEGIEKTTCDTENGFPTQESSLGNLFAINIGILVLAILLLASVAYVYSMLGTVRERGSKGFVPFSNTTTSAQLQQQNDLHEQFHLPRTLSYSIQTKAGPAPVLLRMRIGSPSLEMEPQSL
jgi:hypothetical protein